MDNLRHVGARNATYKVICANNPETGNCTFTISKMIPLRNILLRNRTVVRITKTRNGARQTLSGTSAVFRRLLPQNRLCNIEKIGAAKKGGAEADPVPAPLFVVSLTKNLDS
jgi:hypothetical protein